MIWGVLWAAGMVAVLVFFFRGHLVWFFLWVFGIIAFIAGALLQHLFLDSDKGYSDFVEATSHIGWATLILAITVLVASIVSMVVYTILHGKLDNLKGKAITENRPLSAISLRIPPPMGWSKRKMLGSRSEFVTMESLVDGTATFGERMMVVGVFAACISFFSIFVGAGLMLMKNLLIFVLFPVIPGIWLYYIMREAWQDYQEAKKKVAARSHIEQVTAASKKSSQP